MDKGELLWCLDPWYETNRGRTEMHLYCFNQDSQQLEIVDDTVKPRFTVKGYVDPYLLRGVTGYSGHEYIKLYDAGVPRLVTQVYTRFPFDVSSRGGGARVDVRQLGFKDEASDIYFDDVYKLVKGIRPSMWFEYNPGTKDMKAVDWESAPKSPVLSRLVFDIEIYNKSGEPDPQRDPIVSLGVKTDEYSKMLLADEMDDSGLLLEFVNLIKTYDPSVLGHFYGNRTDIPYVRARCEYHNIPFDIGRDFDKSVPKESQRETISVKGRANIDLYDYGVYYVDSPSNAQNDVYEALFGVRSEYPIDRDRIWDYWDNGMRDEIIRHCQADVDQTYDILNHSLNFGIALSNMTSVPLDQVFQLSTSQRIELAMMRYAYKHNEILNNTPHEGMHKRYIGALTFPPVKGLHADVWCLDYSGMYGNTAKKFNFSPDTICDDGETVIDLGNGEIVRFASKERRVGFYTDMMEEFLFMRAELKRLGVTDKSMDFAIKTICAASTGYFGWVKARWRNYQLIRSIISKTRLAEMTSKSTAEEFGWKFVYGDTDSLFIKKGKLSLDIDKLIDAIYERVGLQIKVDDFFTRIGFGNAKKHYWGITKDGRIVIKGMESIRGEWCNSAKEGQKRIIDLILRDGDVKGAIQYSRDLIRKIQKFEFEIDDVIIRRGMSKGLDEYEQASASVNVARRMDTLPGNKVEYVITRGFGKRTLAERAKSPLEIHSLKEIDVEYYVNKQVGPALGRILDVATSFAAKKLGDVK